MGVRWAYIRRKCKRPPRDKKPGRFMWVLLGILIIGVLIRGLLQVGPLAVELALDAATDDITLVVNDLLSQMLREGCIDYSDMVTLQKDADGNITALVTNMARVNALQAEITGQVTEALLDCDITSVSVPLGSLLGGPLLSGKGPGVKVDILSIVNVITTFKNEFSDAGINQTRHAIKLNVDVNMAVLLAGFTDRSDNVLTEITVAETVIVGKVPQGYATLK